MSRFFMVHCVLASMANTVVQQYDWQF